MRPYYHKITFQPAEFKVILGNLPEMSEEDLYDVSVDWWHGRKMSLEARRASVFMKGYLTEKRLVQIFDRVVLFGKIPDTSPIPSWRRAKWLLVPVSPRVLARSRKASRHMTVTPFQLRDAVLRHVIRAAFGLREPDPIFARIL